MCGITGLLTASPTRRDSLAQIAETMSAQQPHRGPDDAGVWAEPADGIALSFRRLSIIDLSAAGHQPMQSESGRYTLVFNGEVYNYREIGEALTRDGARFRGHSDTEVILASFERWGIAAAVRRFIGMFAIGVWDARERSLSLIRDRLGIKPLYYFHNAGLLAFASELKALVPLPEFDRTVDTDALDDYLRYLYVPAPRTIYRCARKLLPGHILTITDVSRELPVSEPYWSAEEAYRSGVANPFDGSDADAIDELDGLLSDSVRLRMRADVPMGALLSGGVDSSTVVSLMQANATQPTRTFSIAFPGSEHDEAEHARAVATALGTQHTEMSVTADDALKVVPLLPQMFDEPFADPSQIPTYLVCKLARQYVTVALSGDGGDELFAGYERYIRGTPLIEKLTRVPHMARRIAGAGIGTLSAETWDRAYRGLAPLLSGAGSHRLAGTKMTKLGTLLRQESVPAMYRSLVSAAWQEPEFYHSRAQKAASPIERALDRTPDVPLFDRMMLVDQQTYLPDDLLAKVDRASMAVSLEARVPILDHRVVEFAWRLPQRFKTRDGRGKWALRQVLYRRVDPAIVDRPKVGFSVPLDSWLRGPLREWSQDLLLGSRAKTEWLRMDRVQRTWAQFQSGRNEMALGVWAILMFRAWEQRWLQ